MSKSNFWQSCCGFQAGFWSGAIWAGEIVETKRGSWPLRSPWASTDISMVDATALAEKCSEGNLDAFLAGVFFLSTPRNAWRTGAPGIKTFYSGYERGGREATRHSHSERARLEPTSAPHRAPSQPSPQGHSWCTDLAMGFFCKFISFGI